MLNERVAEQVLQRQWQREQATGVADADYDVVAGAAGVLSFLTTIEQLGEKGRAAVQMLLDYLIWLASSDKEHERKRWFLPPDLYPIELHRLSYPDGYFNCGLAHGIPGPLAALAIAWHAGYRATGHAEAMSSLAQWIVDRQLHDSWGINWPGGIPLQQSYSSREWSSLPSCRTAWCYGNPGIARALWLAGTALGDTHLCEIAVEAIESVLRRPVAARGIDIELDPEDTMDSFFPKLLTQTLEALPDVLQAVATGLPGTPQPTRTDRYAPHVTDSDRWLDWTRPATQLQKQVRIWVSSGGVRAMVEGERLLIDRTLVIDPPASEAAAKPGSLLKYSPEGLVVQTGQGALLIQEYRSETKESTSIASVRQQNRASVSGTNEL